MYQEEEYHTIRIEIFSPPETRNDEVRFIADGIDLIGRHWSEMMGLSPDDVLKEPCRLRGAATPPARLFQELCERRSHYPAVPGPGGMGMCRMHRHRPTR